MLSRHNKNLKMAKYAQIQLVCICAHLANAAGLEGPSITVYTPILPTSLISTWMAKRAGIDADYAALPTLHLS